MPYSGYGFITGVRRNAMACLGTKIQGGLGVQAVDCELVDTGGRTSDIWFPTASKGVKDFQNMGLVDKGSLYYKDVDEFVENCDFRGIGMFLEVTMFPPEVY